MRRSSSKHIIRCSAVRSTRRNHEWWSDLSYFVLWADAPHRDHYFHRDTVDHAPSPPRHRDRPSDRRGHPPTGRRRQDALSGSAPTSSTVAVARAASTVRSHWADSLNLAGEFSSSSSSSSRNAGVISAVAVSCLTVLLLPAAAAVA